MPRISEKSHIERLNQYKINIKTKYNAGDLTLERNTDNSKNDDVENGVILEKSYYIKNKLVNKIYDFDPRMTYTFVSCSEENKAHKCPNCGMSGKVKDFIDGCPYCGTYYNVEFTDKDLGHKYHYDKVLKSNKYRIITLLIDILVSFCIVFFFVFAGRRTFNEYDISKIIIYTAILSMCLYYIFYIADAYVILKPIEKYKEKINNKQREFWERTKIDKKVFFNNLNYELSNYYYSKNNIIDYDIIDYIEFNDYKENDKLLVDVIYDVRIVYYENNKIFYKTVRDKISLLKHDKPVLDLKGGTNLIKCPNCGASIDASKGKCEHCNTRVNYLQEWVIK
ncbi:MAG: hypothetical protein IKR57_05480 [Bacilli bacterium]|nr:hypothetical protein [Bacilli bacterium]